MFLNFTLYSLSLLLFGLIALSLGCYSFKKEKTRRNKILTVLAFLIFVDFILESLTCALSIYWLKLFTFNLTFLRIFVPLIFCLFLFDYLKTEIIFEKKFYFPLFVFPTILILILGFSNPWLHLLWTVIPNPDITAAPLFQRSLIMSIINLYITLLSFVVIIGSIVEVKNVSYILQKRYFLAVIAFAVPFDFYLRRTFQRRRDD